MKRAKMTDKGQITIPREIRELLGTRHVEFVVEEDQVILRPVPSARGSLSHYADPSRRKHEEGAWPRAVAEPNRREQHQ